MWNDVMPSLCRTRVLPVVMATFRSIQRLIILMLSLCRSGDGRGAQCPPICLAGGCDWPPQAEAASPGGGGPGRDVQAGHTGQGGGCVISCYEHLFEYLKPTYVCIYIVKPWPQTLSPKTQIPKNPKPRGLGLTLKCCRPPPPTTTTTHHHHHPPHNF